MARMYSRKKGKSGSKKPVKKTVPSWIRYTKKEIELLILKLGKEGKSEPEIGLILRDKYGIPSIKTICGRRVNVILQENKLKPEIPDELTALIKKSVLVRKHFEQNKKDNTAKRGLLLTESKIKRLVKYFKRSGKLDSDWKYDPSRAGFYVK